MSAKSNERYVGDARFQQTYPNVNFIAWTPDRPAPPSRSSSAWRTGAALSPLPTGRRRCGILYGEALVAENLYDDLDRREIADLVPSTAKEILDVGCARGGFGRMLKAQRPDVRVCGIEANATAADTAAERLDEVVAGSFPEDVPRRRFDVITFLDVLEHMQEPWEALRVAHGLLAPGGVVVASLPNVRHYGTSLKLVVTGAWDYTDAGVLDRTHLRFFTKRTMIELFVGCGYDVEEQRPISFSDPAAMNARAKILQVVPRRWSEEFITFQYGIVARPMARGL